MAQTARMSRTAGCPYLIPSITLDVRPNNSAGSSGGRPRPRTSVVIRAPGSVTVTRDIDKARQESKAHIAFYITNMGDCYREQLIRMGHEETVTVVRHAWKKAATPLASRQVVPDALVESLFFAGPVEAWVERLEAQAEAGIDLHTVNVAVHDPQEAARSLPSSSASWCKR